MRIPVQKIILFCFFCLTLISLRAQHKQYLLVNDTCSDSDKTYPCSLGPGQTLMVEEGARIRATPNFSQEDTSNVLMRCKGGNTIGYLTSTFQEKIPCDFVTTRMYYWLVRLKDETGKERVGYMASSVVRPVGECKACWYTKHDHPGVRYDCNGNEKK